MAPKRTGSRKPGSSKAEVVSQAPGQVIEGEAQDVTEANIDTKPLTQEEGGQTQAESEQGSTDSPAEEGESAAAEGEGAAEGAAEGSEGGTAEEGTTSTEGQPQLSVVQDAPVQEAEEGQLSKAAAPASTPTTDIDISWPIQLPTGGTNEDGSPRFIEIFPDTPTRCMTCGATFFAKDAPSGICVAYDAVKGEACGGSLAPVGG